MILRKESKNMKPFLRWAGGKQFLLKYLLKYIPADYKDVTYFEPFLGAGSLFLNLCPKKAVLSDLNKHLIDFYIAIKDSPEQFYRYLLEHKQLSSKKYYYEIRKQFNKNIGKKTVAQAARFLYLNRACYNGIFRVNAQEQFNVPYGYNCDYQRKIVIPTIKEIQQLSNMLKNATLLNCSYEKILPRVKKGDFIYLDPPYPPINHSSYFTHYTKDRFPVAAQSEVANFAKELNTIGCKILLSNADLKKIRKLYKGWNIFSTKVTRVISCKSKKHKVGELIITNYRQ